MKASTFCLLFRLRNLLKKTGQTNVAPWFFTNASGTATQSGNDYTFVASGVDRVIQGGVSITGGAQYTGGVWIVGSGSARIFGFDGAGSTTLLASATFSATPTWFSGTFTAAAGGSGGGIGVYNNAAATPGASFTILGAQLVKGAVLGSYQPRA
jgi:hypothetical protein